MHTQNDDIYTRHFGLDRPLFEAAAAVDRHIFLGENRSKIMDDLSIALSSRDSVVVLTGAAGIGKTTLGYAAAASTADAQSIVSITTPPETARELVEFLLLEFGINAKDLRRAESIQLWKQIVAEQTVSEKRTVILIENAQNWTVELLQTLHAITASEPNGNPGVNVVLTGKQELRALLQSPEIESLAQRLRAVCHVHPMTEDETRGFFEQKLANIGGNSSRLFGPGSLGLLHLYSHGVPRVSCNLCESAFSLAANRDEVTVTAKTIRDAAVELHGLGHTVNDEDAPVLPLSDKCGDFMGDDTVWDLLVHADESLPPDANPGNDTDESTSAYDEDEFAAQIEAALSRG